jgi:hypothetical protein
MAAIANVRGRVAMQPLGRVRGDLEALDPLVMEFQSEQERPGAGDDLDAVEAGALAEAGHALIALRLCRQAACRMTKADPIRDVGGYQVGRSPRAEPAMTSSHPTPAPCQWFARLAAVLDRRSAPGLALLFLGAVLARGRRTVTSWSRAAGLSDQFRPCYTAVAAAGKKAERIAAYLLLWVVKPLSDGVGRMTLAKDDTPTPRYGPHVEGDG